jgi:hypothetical protein
MLRLSLLLNNSQPAGCPINLFAVPNSDVDQQGRRTYTCFRDIVSGNPETLQIIGPKFSKVVYRAAAVQHVNELFSWQNAQSHSPMIKGYNLVGSESTIEELIQAFSQPVIPTHSVSVACHDGIAAVFRENRLIVANYRPIVATTEFDPFNL